MSTYFEHYSNPQQPARQTREPKREYDAAMAMRAPHKALSEAELASYLRAAIHTNRMARR